MAIYIATTTLGGFSGRFFTGQLAALFSWRVPFFCLGASLAVVALLLRALPPDARPAFRKVPLAAIPEVLRKPGFFKIYGLAFCFFFVFSAALNYLPFRLAHISGGYSASRTGAMYLGYLMGISSSLLSMRTVRLLGGEVRAIAAGVGVMFLALCLFAIPSQTALFFSLFVLCSGMFLSHSVAPGAINSCSGETKGLVNGLYLSSYYSGGALGAYLPGVIQAHFGWSAFLGSLFFFLSLAMYFALTLKAASFQLPMEPENPTRHVHH
jgi:YNFM family putative membrane transporter